MAPDKTDKDGSLDAEKLDAEYGEIPEIPDDGDEWEALAAEAIKAAESATAAVRPDPIEEDVEEESKDSASPPASPRQTATAPPRSAPVSRPWLIIALALTVLFNAGLMTLLLLRLPASPTVQPQSSPPSIQPPPQPATQPSDTVAVEPVPVDPISQAREKLGAGYLMEASGILEDLLANSTALTSAQRITIYLMLSRTHRELGNLDEAGYYAQLASGELLDEVDPTDLLHKADTYRARGEHARARRLLYAFLARADALTGSNETLETSALIKIGDSFRDEALAKETSRTLNDEEVDPAVPGVNKAEEPR